ncbi:hypothetical protein [Nocardia sp. CA-290969]|uniref:hypothetical protein n=1 Tax=Nocardia sp. CA-290969 TaxID=3239986 RepID=UPI003D8C15E8
MPRLRPMVAAALAAAAILTLAGCSSDDTDTATAALATTPVTADTGASAPIDVAVGTPFEISNQNGPTATVTVVSIEVDPQCATQFGTVEPAAGTRVALELDVATTGNPPLKYISDQWFQELAPDGYTKDMPAANDLCIADRETFDKNWTANAKYRGWVLVDVSDPASSLLMSDIWDTRTPRETHRIPITG